jgi:ABC-2 type transport system ATP-binding protein
MDEAERCGRVGFLLRGRLIACGSPDRLRRDLDTVVLDLRCRHPRAAAQRLRRTPGITDAILFGDRLHVPFPRTAFDAAAALSQIQRAGVDVDAWQVREPSLEDVFLAFADRTEEERIPSRQLLPEGESGP